MRDSVLALEEDAFDAWPAAEVKALHGWRLRFNHGVTNRANSVWPNHWEEGPSLEDRISTVEAFYRKRKRPAIFQLSEAARPRQLDERLAERQYESYSPVYVQVARAAEVAAACAERQTGRAARCREDLDEGWFAFSGPSGRFGGAAATVYRELLVRIEAPCCFAAVETSEGVAAAGLGVLGRERVGVFSMRTAEAQRSRGLGRRVLGAIADWAVQRGGEVLYLQVEADNAPARRLYEGSGFATRTRYHYRRKPL